MRRLPLLLPLLIALAACGDAAEPRAATGGNGELPEGRSFVATGATEGGRSRPLVARVAIEFRAGGATSIATGCNTAGGTARLRGGRLVSVGDGFAVTDMACLTPGAMEQEAFVMSVVGGEPELLLDGDVLDLRTATAEIRFLDQKVADPDRPLEGTRWQVTGQFGPVVASSSVASAGQLVLADGRLRFTGPCHDLEGPATVVGSTVRLGTLTTSATRPCGEDQQRAESGVVPLLTGSMRATVKARTLRLEHDDGTGITFVEAP